jgi:hypothetical protein
MRGSRFSMMLTGLLIVTVLGGYAAPAALAEEPVLMRIAVSDRASLDRLSGLNLDIATVRPGEYADAWLVAKERLEVLARGFDVDPIVDTSRDYLETLGLQGYVPGASREWTSYPSFSQMQTWLQGMESSYPAIADLFSIGQSTNGRDLWVMKISDNVAVEEGEPEFKYIGAMHGNEIIAVPMCLDLIEHLLVNYGSDPDITGLVDNREIFILPLMNPDGYESGSRYNAQGHDLNRSFPDFIDDPNNTPAGRPTEVQLVMNWQLDHTFVLSANFHAGALVVNYPYDCTWNYCPDDTFFYHMSLGYSSRNLPMYNSSSFTDGVVRGVEWYLVYGGMQDWNYWWYADYEVTIELSDSFSPPASSIPGYWDDNRDAMLYLIDLAGKGISGTVTDSVSGLPVAADVEVAGITMNTPVHTDPDHGNYVRPLTSGSYNLTYSAPGYFDQTLTSVPVTWEQETVRNVQLVPMPAEPNLDFHSVALDDSAGNGNGIPEPGETVDLSVTLENIGIGTATGVSALLSESDPYVTVTQNSSTYPSIPQSGTGTSNSDYTIYISPSAPEQYGVTFTLNISGDGGLSDTGTFGITISGDLFRDEMESGDSLWTHSAGQGSDDWAIVTEGSSHSPTHCWFSSDAGSLKDDYLVTDPVNLELNGELSFWHRYNMESGYDGCVIEISTDGGSNWTDLGPYITQGGYNDTISTGYSSPIGGRSAWSGSSGSSMTEVIADLGSFSGAATRVRFRLACDSSVSGTGWYVDDVRITGESDTPPPTDTVAVSMSCTPDNGVLPFTAQMAASLTNLTSENRRAAGRINVVIGNGNSYTNWRGGFTNLSNGETYNSIWNQYLPALGSLVGSNVFTLLGEDVTPAPYNQPPYAPAGDTDNDGCTITASTP